MVVAIESAQKVARRVIESSYNRTLCVIEHKKVKDVVTKLISYDDVSVITDLPCKLSYTKIQAANETGSSVSVTQSAKLFIAPEITIKPGCKIRVTQAGVTIDYTASGVPAVYPTHQEIILELFERWA